MILFRNQGGNSLDFLVLTKTGGILGPFVTLLGFIMDYIYKFLEFIGIPNLALSIILFTLIVNLLMMPLTIRQQKFTKLSAVMNPELNKIKNKYQGKTDQASQMKMQNESQAVYKKYGTNMASGCLPMLITLPIMLGLYQVILNMPAYIEPIKALYMQVAEPISQVSGGAEIMSKLIEDLSIHVSNFDFSSTDKIVDVLYKLRSAGWADVSEAFSASPAVTEAISNTQSSILNINSMIGGLNISDSPLTNGWWPGILIPLFAMISQFLSSKIAMATQSQNQSAQDNPMGGSMKMMNNIFPIMSFFLCMSMQVGVGLYWIANAVFRTLATVIANKYIDSQGIDAIVEKNQEKAAKKAEKRGDKPSRFEQYASMNTKQLEAEEAASKRKSISEIANTTVKDYKPIDKNKAEGKGSISDYANMLKRKD